MRRLESLQSDTAKYIIHSREYDNLTDKPLLGLLSGILGFTSIEKVEEYIHKAQNDKSTDSLAEVDGFKQWRVMYKRSTHPLLYGINALRALLDLGLTYVVRVACDKGDYEILSVQLSLHPEYINDDLFWSKLPLTLKVDILKDVNYKLTYDELKSIINATRSDTAVDDIEWLLRNTDLTSSTSEDQCSLLYNTDYVKLSLFSEILLAYFLSINSDLRGYIQNSLNNDLFTILTFSEGGALSYPLLKVLEKYKFNIYPQPTRVRVTKDILVAYVGVDDEEIRKILIDKYGAEVTLHVVEQAILGDNIDLAIEWLLKYDIDPMVVISQAVVNDSVERTIQIIEMLDMDIESLGYVYYAVHSVKMLDTLQGLGIPLGDYEAGLLINKLVSLGNTDDIVTIIERFSVDKSKSSDLYVRARTSKTLNTLYILGIPLLYRSLSNLVSVSNEEMLEWLITVAGVTPECIGGFVRDEWMLEYLLNR